jgi:hypothetical protein
MENDKEEVGKIRTLQESTTFSVTKATTYYNRLFVLKYLNMLNAVRFIINITIIMIIIIIIIIITNCN